MELLEAHWKEIERQNPLLNAFSMQFPFESRAEARRLENEPWSGPLHGIPLTIKDSFDMAGVPTLCGSRFRIGHIAERDSTAVHRLKAAGGIILGKTNCPEFLRNWETDNHITGRTNNPWNANLTPGGSSGGESAAIAAFCSAGGVGSDGGGSIRVPAHFCGIAGLKPTPGRVSAAGHFPAVGHPGGLLGVAGPMARTAEDLKILFEALAGYDARDPFSAPVPLREPGLDGLRIGVMEQWRDIPVQESVRDAVRKAASLLGPAAEPFAPAGLGSALDVWWFFFGELPAAYTRDAVSSCPTDAHWTGTELMNMVDEAKEITGRNVVDMLAERDRLRATLLAQMERYPVLLLPACGVAAFPHRKRRWQAGGQEITLLEAMAPATPFNLMSFPAVVIPMDVTGDGIPVGVQLVGKPYSEELLLEVAIRLEKARGPFLLPRSEPFLAS